MSCSAYCLERALQIRSQNWADRFLLVPLDAKQHAARLYPLFHGESTDFVWDYLRDGPFPSLDRYEEHIKTFQHRPDVLPFVVEDASKRSLVGKLMVIRLAPDTSSVEIAYVLFSPDVHGSGASIAAVGRLADHIFLTLEKTTCHWKCDKLNSRSARFAEKMGFSLENEIISDFQTKGRVRNTLVFSQSRNTWLDNRLELMRSLSDVAP